MRISDWSSDVCSSDLGFLAAATSWRWPFVVYAVPTAIFVVLAWRMKEPVRGAHEREAAGADAETIGMEEAHPSFAEGWRIVWRIESLRRIWWSLPFPAARLIGSEIGRAHA